MFQSTPSPPASPRQVLLGLFIIAQLVFLTLSNLLGFVKWFNSEHAEQWGPLVQRLAPRFEKQQGHGWQWCDELEKNMDRWMQVTLQDQSWCLFAPNPFQETGFPGLLLQSGRDSADWGKILDATTGPPVLGPGVVLLSDNEPADMDDFLRVGKFRLRRFEGTIFVSAVRKTIKMSGQERLETPDEWAARLTRRVHDVANQYRDSTLAYMKWRLKAWQQKHPEQPLPGQVILLERFYRIHRTDEPRGWDGPFVIPMLRWRPKAGQADADVVLDAYDFSERRFAPVNR